MYIFMRSWPTLILYSYQVFPEGGVRGKLHQNRDDKKNLHFFSPEYGCECDHIFTSSLNFWFIYFIFPSLFSACEDDYAIDIFSFGICALEVSYQQSMTWQCYILHTALYSTEMWQVPYEIMFKLLQMAVLEIQANGDSVVSKEAIASAGQSLEDPLMRVRVQGWVMFNRHDICFSKYNRTHDCHLADDKTGKQTQQHRLTFKEEPILDLQ